MSNLAPIAIFGFRRPEHLRTTLESLMACEGFDRSSIHMFFDGPRGPADEADVAETRRIARQILGDKAHYYMSATNRGLAASIIEGVESLVNAHGRIIVIEDDLVFHPEFLSFMNTALDRYANDERVYAVSGYIFGRPDLNPNQAVFLPMTASWGWATWKRAWQAFDPDAVGWERLQSDTDLRRRFNFDNVYDYATMLVAQMQRDIGSWAIRWYWSVFHNNGLVVYPAHSLVKNIGQDGSGSHGGGWFRDFRGFVDTNQPAPSEFPSDLRLSPTTCAAVQRAIFRQNGGMIGRIRDALRRVVRR